MITRKSNSDDAFTIERHGDITVITATPALERLAFGLEEQAAELILRPLERQENPLILFDLSQVDYFGSMFLALLIRCWKLALSQGGSMATFRASRRVPASCCASLPWTLSGRSMTRSRRRWRPSSSTDRIPGQNRLVLNPTATSTDRPPGHHGSVFPGASSDGR